jgi:hypothetical protein
MQPLVLRHLSDSFTTINFAVLIEDFTGAFLIPILICQIAMYAGIFSLTDSIILTPIKNLELEVG